MTGWWWWCLTRIPPGVLWASCLCGLVWTLTWGIIPNIPATPHLSPLLGIPWYVRYTCGSGTIVLGDSVIFVLFFFPFSFGGFYPCSLKLGPLSLAVSNLTKLSEEAPISVTIVGP